MRVSVSKQFAISSTASILAMAAFALFAPDGVRLGDLVGGESVPVNYEASAPVFDLPLPDLPFFTQ